MTQPITAANAGTPLIENDQNQGCDVERRVGNCYKKANVFLWGTFLSSIAIGLTTKFTVCSELTDDECFEKYKFLPVVLGFGFISALILTSKALADRYCG